MAQKFFFENENLLDNWILDSDSAANYFAIPEPATPLTLLGLFGLTMFRARQRKNI
ncbi:MAG: PEP-CTERM sorting domain-containing protein [Pirellulaceae bacterium]|nr:PEP-CTERM sorting domain-containing protein [Pirellulaceae bacterium]